MAGAAAGDGTGQGTNTRSANQPGSYKTSQVTQPLLSTPTCALQWHHSHPLSAGPQQVIILQHQAQPLLSLREVGRRRAGGTSGDWHQAPSRVRAVAVWPRAAEPVRSDCCAGGTEWFLAEQGACCSM